MDCQQSLLFFPLHCHKTYVGPSDGSPMPRHRALHSCSSSRRLDKVGCRRFYDVTRLGQFRTQQCGLPQAFVPIKNGFNFTNMSPSARRSYCASKACYEARGCVLEIAPLLDQSDAACTEFHCGRHFGTSTSFQDGYAHSIKAAPDR
jgi:hypothetical protein